MNDLIERFRLRDILITRLRAGLIDINFNGHFRTAEGIVQFKDTWMAKSEIDYPADYKIKHHNDFFFDSWNITNLIIRSDPDSSPTPEIAAKYAQTIEDFKNGVRTSNYCIKSSHDCFECGEHIVPHFDGKTITFASIHANQKLDKNEDVPSCRFAGGMKDYSVNIDVPSGRLIFANDLRYMVPEEISDHCVSYTIGMRNVVVDTAKQGFLTAFVGNSCPGVFQEGNKIIVGYEGMDYEGMDNEDKPLHDFGNSIGSICTDLWWFYAVDGDIFDAYDGERQEPEATAIVAPGTYRMTVHTKPALSSGVDSYRGGDKYVTIEQIK